MVFRPDQVSFRPGVIVVYITDPVVALDRSPASSRSLGPRRVMPSGARIGRLLLAALPLAVDVSVFTLYVVPSCRAAHGVLLAAKTRLLPTLVR